MNHNSDRLSSNVAVVVPVYKNLQSLEHSEFCLLDQIKAVFTNREIIIILPNHWRKIGNRTLNSKL